MLSAAKFNRKGPVKEQDAISQFAFKDSHTQKNWNQNWLCVGGGNNSK